MLQKNAKSAPKDPTQPKDVGKPLTPPSQVLRLRYSPNGKTLVAACFDAVLRRWDVSGAEPKELPAFTGHGGWATTMAFGPAATPRLYSGDSWGKLIARDDTAADAKPLWAVEAAHDGWLRMLVVSPDGNTVATCGRDGFVRLWAAKDGAKGRELAVGADCLAVNFTPDGRSILAGDLFGIVHQFDLGTGKVTRTLDVKELYRHDRMQDVGGVRILQFDPAGKTLVVAGAVPTTGAFVQAVPHLVGFDFASGKRTFTHKGESEKEGYVTDLRWHPTDGYLMLTTSGQPGNGKLLFWKPAEPKPFFAGAKPNSHSFDLHPSGKMLAMATTNANSSGNGRPKKGDGVNDYPMNNSPIYFWEMPGSKV